MKGVVNRRDGQRMTVPSLHYTLHLACFTFTSPLPFFTRIISSHLRLRLRRNGSE